ncbi:unnamed protein product [Mycena citricolor]|uniref:GS domain-containing protein n=1 Tax=Mycena citricolor TaxID=2018698 RepID=A0AAD2HD54_9AGAR|nr:unnamed protein product [Mycena citricolor]
MMFGCRNHWSTSCLLTTMDDDKRLLQLLGRLSLHPTPVLPPTLPRSESPVPHSSSYSSPPALVQRTVERRPVYQYQTPGFAGLTNDWSVAGALTQDVPGSRAYSVSPRKKNRRPRPAAYVVFVGREPGVCDSWDQCNEKMLGYPCALYRGYTSRADADAAFLYAQQRGWTSSPDADVFRYVPPIPVTDDDYETYNPLSGNESANDQLWYVVYRGLRPGVYRSSLESQLNVVGVPGQLFESVEGEDAARAKFADAQRKGVVKILTV